MSAPPTAAAGSVAEWFGMGQLRRRGGAVERSRGLKHRSKTLVKGMFRNDKPKPVTASQAHNRRQRNVLSKLDYASQLEVVRADLPALQTAISAALMQFGPDFVTTRPDVAFRILASAGHGTRGGFSPGSEMWEAEDPWKEHPPQRVIVRAQWMIVAPMLPAIVTASSAGVWCLSCVAGTTHRALEVLSAGAVLYRRLMAANRPVGVRYGVFRVFAGELGAIRAEHEKLQRNCPVALESNERILHMIPKVRTAPSANSVSSSHRGVLWITDRALVFERARTFHATEIQRTCIDHTVRVADGSGVLHPGIEVSRPSTDSSSVFRFATGSHGERECELTWRIMRELVAFRRFLCLDIEPLTQKLRFKRPDMDPSLSDSGAASTATGSKPRRGSGGRRNATVGDEELPGGREQGSAVAERARDLAAEVLEQSVANFEALVRTADIWVGRRSSLQIDEDSNDGASLGEAEEHDVNEGYNSDGDHKEGETFGGALGEDESEVSLQRTTSDFADIGQVGANPHHLTLSEFAFPLFFTALATRRSCEDTATRGFMTFIEEEMELRAQAKHERKATSSSVPVAIGADRENERSVTDDTSQGYVRGLRSKVSVCEALSAHLIVRAVRAEGRALDLAQDRRSVGVKAPHLSILATQGRGSALRGDEKTANQALLAAPNRPDSLELPMADILREEAFLLSIGTCAQRGKIEVSLSQTVDARGKRQFRRLQHLLRKKSEEDGFGGIDGLGNALLQDTLPRMGNDRVGTAGLASSQFERTESAIDLFGGSRSGGKQRLNDSGERATERVLAACLAAWLEDEARLFKRNVVLDAIHFKSLGQGLRLMRQIVAPVKDAVANLGALYDHLSSWTNPVVSSLVLFAWSLLIMLGLATFFPAIFVFALTAQLLRVRDKSIVLRELSLPPKTKRNIIERLRGTRQKYNMLKHAVYRANIVLLKLRGLLTGEDRDITNMLLQVFAVLGTVLLVTPGWVLHLVLVAHVFTCKLESRRRTKVKILGFLKRVWITIPPSPVPVFQISPMPSSSTRSYRESAEFFPLSDAIDIQQGRSQSRRRRRLVT